MRLRLIVALVASACLASAGSITLESPFTARGGADWFTTINPDGTFSKGRIQNEALGWVGLHVFGPGAGSIAFSGYYSQLPTGVTYTGATYSLRLDSTTLTQNGDVDLSMYGQGASGTAHVTVGESPAFFRSHYFYVRGGACVVDAALVPRSLTSCLGDLIDPSGSVEPIPAISTSFWVSLENSSVTLSPGATLPKYSWCPDGCPVELGTTLSVVATGVALLSFTYDDPAQVPEPSTWALAGVALCALPIVRSQRA